MKIKNLAVVAFCTLALSACSSEEDFQTKVTPLSQSKLIDKLSLVNDSLKSQYISRGLVGDIDAPGLADESWLKVVWADASGAGRGWREGRKFGTPVGVATAIVYGVASSAIAYNENCEKINQPGTELALTCKELESSGMLQDPSFIYKAYYLSNKSNSRSFPKNELNIASRDSLFASQQHIGIAHNNIINMIAYDKSIEEINSINIPANDKAFNIINSDEFKTIYKQEVSADQIENDYNNADIKQKVLILKLYRNAIAMCPNNAYDIEFVVNLYLKEIYDSNEITEADRKEIYSTIAVGAYSKLLWGEEAKLGISDSEQAIIRK